MAKPGYHDPVYDPIMVTGEATPEEIPEKQKLRARIGKLLKELQAGGDFLLNWPKYESGRTGLMEPPKYKRERSGLGTVLFEDQQKAYEKAGKGDSPWGGPDSWNPLDTYVKHGRGADAAAMLSLPLDWTPMGKGGAVVGAVRRTSDKVSPGVGQHIAEQLWNKEHGLWGPPVNEFDEPINIEQVLKEGPPIRDIAVAMSANAALPDLQKSFANYFARYAGMPDDPLRKLPLLKRHNPAPNNQFYSDEDLTSMPFRVAKPYEALPDPYAIGPARDQRPELEFPPTTSAASGTDDLMGASMNRSEEVLQNIKEVEPYLTANPENLESDLNRLRGLLTAVTRDSYYAQEYLSPEAVNTALKVPSENLKKMGLTPGKVDEFLSEMVAADPTARMAAPLDLDYNNIGPAAGALKHSLQSKEFRDHVASLPPEYVKSKPFHVLYEGFAAKIRNDFLTWKQKQVAPPVQQALSPETGKPAPLGVWPGTDNLLFPPDHGWYQVTPDQVLYEGTSLNHCLGKEIHGHPRAIREGREIAYSFRTGDNRPLMTVAVYPQRNGGFEVAEIKAINNQQPHNVGDRRLPVEAKAFIDRMGFTLGGSDDAKHLTNVMNRIEQSPNYIREGAAQPIVQGANPNISDKTLEKIATLFSEYKVEKHWDRDVAVPKDPGRGPLGYTREKDISPGAERWEIGLLDLENPGTLTAMDPGAEGVFKTEIAKFLGGAKEPSPKIQAEIINRAKLEEDWAAGRIKLREGYPEGQNSTTFEIAVDPLAARYDDDQGIEHITRTARIYDNALGQNIGRVAFEGDKLWVVSNSRPPGYQFSDKKRGLYWIRPVKYREMTQAQYDYLRGLLNRE